MQICVRCKALNGSIKKVSSGAILIFQVGPFKFLHEKYTGKHSEAVFLTFPFFT